MMIGDEHTDNIMLVEVEAAGVAYSYNGAPSTAKIWSTSNFLFKAKVSSAPTYENYAPLPPEEGY
jgi:hypothetical protein